MEEYYNKRFIQLQKLSIALSRILTNQEAAHEIGALINSLYGDVSNTVCLLNESRTDIEQFFANGYPVDDLAHWQTLALTDPYPMQETIRTGKALFIESLEEAQRLFPRFLEILSMKRMAWVTLPLVIEDQEIIGVLGLSFNFPHQFSQLDRDFLQIFADQCAQAIYRVRLYQREREARKQAELSQERLRYLAEASSLFNQSLDFKSTLRTIVQLAVPIIADWCSIYLLQEDTTTESGYKNELIMVEIVNVDPAQTEKARQIREKFPMKFNDPGGVGAVMRSGKSLLVTSFEKDMLEHPENYFGPADLRGFPPKKDMLEHPENYLGSEVISYIIVPFLANERVVGTLTLVTSKSKRVFSESDLLLAEELARRAGQALENAKLYQQAQTALRNRDDFLIVASHELKTPIATIKGYTQLALRQINAEVGLDLSKLSKNLGTIDVQTKKLVQLINQLLDISRLETNRLILEISPFDLNLLVEEVAAATRLRTTMHMIVFKPLLPTCEVKADSLRIEQVLNNLLDNAVKYSPNPGTITVEISRDVSPNGQVLLTITDQGLGIAPEHRENVFKQFYQVKNHKYMGGMGLGLYITKQIIELHGGKILFQFPPEGGTRAIISF